MAKLTKKEQAWVDEVNAVMARCPSPKKIGFYTIGDPSIALYDLRRIGEVMARLDGRASSDWCTAVQNIGAGFDETIEFPSAVESTAG
ncbi:hypothetical protein SB6411_02091 [Klebsiella spallanzanii]|uniref:Uncharacterized protein n=1 Tax=Klebsiella spallanzanii TaxID=2587528 RepID=A0ABY6VGY7_9ENTR|nr:hypothetical protein [Klebsiella spallanzanii]VUS65106.1 hypothetical protein SB6411_02091 [Klebsiella spallanzanii]HBT1933606.1 hypothetical protein [Klebsiella pneumoniae]HBT1943544.1 hypothetical protein [Klebsiella pneumoniae]